MTEEYRPSAAPPQSPKRPALVVAFPRSLACELERDETSLGSEWLLQYGIHDPKASARHCRVTLSGGQARIEDAGSRNGTWLNGRRIVAPEGLKDGDVVRVGCTAMVFRPAFQGGLAPSTPLGQLVAPFGLVEVRRALTGWKGLSPLTVLIEGETGAGKELLAAAVRDHFRPGKQYERLNLAAIPANLFEAQLFGHAKGAFSGADSPQLGTIRSHNGGTVLLDEIGELPLELQPKLLRLLENREVQPAGGKTEKVDVLILAATNQPLAALVKEGRFRLDLLARLETSRLELPPLRDRTEDIFTVAQSLPTVGSSLTNPDLVEIEAVERLMLERWATNVRGLMTALQQATRLAPGLQAWTLEQVLGPVASHRQGPTREDVQVALAKSGNNQSEAAILLGISRGKLRRLMPQS